MPLAKDIWRPLIVDAPMSTILRSGSIDGLPHRWLPQESYMCFLADPFGIERGGQQFVFVERYDYRIRRGTIDCLHYEGGQLLQRRQVLAEPWHLSYPFVFEADGAIWMLPEAHRSGGLMLYRATEFPWRWDRAATIALDEAPVDATPVFYDGFWWLLYAVAGRKDALYAAWAERLEGPWTAHPGNPVRLGRDSTRPGGTPLILDGTLILPVQDCTRTYGGAVRPLAIHRLDPDGFEAEPGNPIRAPAMFAPYDEGLHTISAMGERTLVDVKHRLLSPRSLMVLAGREFALG